MEGRRLRNRVVEAEDNVTCVVEEEQEDWPCGQSEGFDGQEILCEGQSQNVANSQIENVTEEIERGKVGNRSEVGVSPSNIQEMFKAVLEGVKTANAELKESLENNIEHKIEQVKQELQESTKILQERMDNYNEELNQSVRNLREELRQEHAKFQKEVTDQVRTERTKYAKMVNQVQKETEQEIVGMKHRVEEISSGLEFKIEQSVKNTADVTAGLDSKIGSLTEVVRNVQTEIAQSSDGFQKQQREKLEHLCREMEIDKTGNKAQLEKINQMINELKTKLHENSTAPNSEVNIGLPSIDSSAQISRNTVHADMSVANNNGVKTVNLHQKLSKWGLN
jgi:DNA repair exonuclease SbcCD ATPase subunit